MASGRKPATKKGSPRSRGATRKQRIASRKGPAAKRRPAVKRRPASKEDEGANQGAAGSGKGRVPGWSKILTRLVWSGVLIFLTAITTVAFFQGIAAERGPNFWSTAPVYFFGLGLGLLPIFIWAFREGLLYLYVFGHEVTHVIFIYICGGRVYGDIRVSVRGGHVVTNKSNWLISLSPYFIPFYTVVIGTGFFVARLFVDLSTVYTINSLSFQPLYFFYALIGFTWTMHIYYTLTILLKDQPDLRMHGTIPSLLVIYLVNSIVVIAFVTLASKELSFYGFVSTWLGHARNAIGLVLVPIAGLIW